MERFYTGGVVAVDFVVRRSDAAWGRTSSFVGWFRNACTELARDLFLESNFERRNVRWKNFGGSARRRFGWPALWSARVRAVGRNELVSRLQRIRSRNHGLHLLSCLQLNSGSGKLFGVPHGRSRFTNSVSTQAGSGKVRRRGEARAPPHGVSLPAAWRRWTNLAIQLHQRVRREFPAAVSRFRPPKIGFGMSLIRACSRNFSSVRSNAPSGARLLT
jgi:hypothetical protein